MAFICPLSPYKMVKTGIFKKAVGYLDKVELEFESPTMSFFKIKGNYDTYEIRITKDFSFIEHSCTCKYMSNTAPTNLCSHKLACMLWLMEKEKTKDVGVETI